MKKIISFTLDEKIISLLKEEADNLGISVSSLLTMILRGKHEDLREKIKESL